TVRRGLILHQPIYQETAASSSAGVLRLRSWRAGLRAGRRVLALRARARDWRENCFWAIWRQTMERAVSRWRRQGRPRSWLWKAKRAGGLGVIFFEMRS